MIDMPATLRKRAASSPLNAEARQPITHVGSISPPRVLCLAPTSNSVPILYQCGCVMHISVTPDS